MSNSAYADTCNVRPVYELENTVRETTLHTQKSIEAEKKQINALKKQYSILIRETVDIRTTTSKLDDDTRTYYEQFKTMQNSYDSIKKSQHFLEENERELSDKIQRIMQASSENEKERNQTLKMYQDKWDLSYQHYEQHPLAVEHKVNTGKMIQIEELVKSYESQVRQLDADIFKHKCERSRQNDLAVLVSITRFVKEIAMLKTESSQVETEITLAVKEKQKIQKVLQEKRKIMEQAAKKVTSIPQRTFFKRKQSFAQPSIGFQGIKLFVPNLSATTQRTDVREPPPVTAVPCHNSQKDVAKSSPASSVRENINLQPSSQKSRQMEDMEIKATEPRKQKQLFYSNTVQAQVTTDDSESNFTTILTQTEELSSNLNNNATSQNAGFEQVTQRAMKMLPSDLNSPRRTQQLPKQSQTPSLQRQVLTPNAQQISTTSSEPDTSKYFRQPPMTSNEMERKESQSSQSTTTSQHLAEKQQSSIQNLTLSGQQMDLQSLHCTPENPPCGNEILTPYIESPQFAYPRRLMHNLEAKNVTINRREAAHALTPTPPEIIRDSFLNSATKDVTDRQKLSQTRCEDQPHQETRLGSLPASQEQPSSPNMRSETAKLPVVPSTPRKANPQNNSGFHVQGEMFNNFDNYSSKPSASNVMEAQNDANVFQHPNAVFGKGDFSFGTSFERSNQPAANQAPESNASFNFGSYNEALNPETSTGSWNPFDLFRAGEPQTPNTAKADGSGYFNFMSGTSPDTPPKNMSFSFF